MSPISLRRRRAAALCLMASPVVQLLSASLWPVGSDGATAAEVHAVAAQPGAWSAAVLTELLAGALLIPGAIGVLGYLRGRGRVLGVVAAVLGIGGVLGTWFGGGGNVILQSVVEHADARTAAAIIDGFGEVPAAMLGLVLIWSGVLGIVLLGWAALRGGLVRWWVPALLTAGVLMGTLLDNDLYGPAAAGVQVLTAAGGVLLGIALFRERRVSSAPVAGDVEQPTARLSVDA